MANTYSYSTGRPRPPQPSQQPAGAPGGSVNYRMKLLSAVNTMPPLPMALNRLMGMLNSENASAGQVAQVIEQDSVLSGSVLRCVNSAYYGLPGRVSAIRQAVTLLGFGTVRNVALAFSMRRMMSRNQPSPKLYTAYSKHALGTAIMTQLLAYLTHAEDVEAAFAGGLFHDIGKLLILSNAQQVLPQIIETWEAGDGDYQEAEREVLEITHSELSASILEGWRLPQPIQVAARFHHAPNEQPDYEEGVITLAHLVHVADVAVNSEGIQTISSPKHPPAPPEEAFASIGIEDPEQLMDKFRAEFAGLQNLFQ